VWPAVNVGEFAPPPVPVVVGKFAKPVVSVAGPSVPSFVTGVVLKSSNST
jgi:hypothetical protein